MVSETRQRLNVVLGLPEESVAQREDGDADGEDREPPDGTAEGHGIPPAATDGPGELLWCARNVLRRLTISQYDHERHHRISRPLNNIAGRTKRLYRADYGNTGQIKKPRQSLGIGLNYCFTKIPTSSPEEVSFTNITGPDIIPSNIVKLSLNGINVIFDALYV